MTFTHALSTNNYGPSKFIVDANAANGTHITIATALTAASSGDTIFIRPGTYTENLTLKAGVNLTAYGSDSSPNGTGKVIISGTCTFTATGTVTISGIQLQTNSAALLAVTGTLASVVSLDNCYLNCTNNSGITFSSSNAAARIIIKNSRGDLGTTGINLFAHSSAGSLIINTSVFTNTGASTTASTQSAGTLTCTFSQFAHPITTSGSTAIATISWCNLDTSSQNVTAFTHGSTSASNSLLSFNTVTTGSASSISISASALLFVDATFINSTNTNAITGAGTISYQGLIFVGSSSTINTTTQTASGTLMGSRNTAPSAGFLGQNTVSTATTVALVSNTAKTVTSISLTAGVWDVSALAYIAPSGGTGVAQAIVVGISTTDNTLTGTVGIEQFQFSQVALSSASGVVPSYRVTLSATTTYYLVVLAIFTSTTCPANGRISATRVG